MERHAIRWRTTLTYAAVIGLLSLILILVINGLIRGAYERAAENIVRAEANLASANPALVDAVRHGDRAALQGLIERWAAASSGQIIMMDAAGAILANSDANGGDGSGAGASIEVRQALSQGFGRNVRTAGAEGERTLYLAFPVRDGDATVGVIRWAQAAGLAYAQMRALQWQIDGAVLLIALALIGLMLFERRRSAALIRRLTVMVEHALYLDFEGHVLASYSGELGQLTGATNRLVDKYRKATKRRAREKDRLTTILKHMSSGAMILSEAGQVRLINAAAAEILQTTPEKAARQTFVQVVRDHHVAEVWQRCRVSDAEESEAVELSADRFVRVTATPFVGGDAAGYLVILQDLSAVRRLEKVRRDFVSNVSHELRTPLASLKALVDTLRDGALDDPPAAQRFLDRIEIEVDKMTQLVQELLELSRIESGQAPLRLNPVAVSQVVQPAVDRLAAQAERAGVALEVTVPASLPPVVVDLERMQQVVINLVHNAIKFTPKDGRVMITAAIDTVESGENAASDAAGQPEFVRVAVRDTGVGIPRAEQGRIFERFYKADRSRSGGGTGLGLAIAKHTVQAHGGRIWVESLENSGSTFSFTLPTDVPTIAPAPTAAATADAAPPTTGDAPIAEPTSLTLR